MLGGIIILYLTDHTLKQLGGYEPHRLKKIEAQRYHIKNKLSKKEEH